MEPSYVGAVWMTGANYAPYGFAMCDGRTVAISENETLYTLLGTTYGGDGVQTFLLPDLRGRTLIGQGQGSGSNYVMGQKAGSEQATLTVNTLGAHTHLLNVGTAATAQIATANMFINQPIEGTANVEFFSDAAVGATLIASTISSTGNNIPFNILQPVLAVSYVISLYGIYPTSN